MDKSDPKKHFNRWFFDSFSDAFPYLEEKLDVIIRIYDLYLV